MERIFNSLVIRLVTSFFKCEGIIVKQINRWFFLIVSLATVALTCGQSIYADFVEDFNAMNGGKGFKFSYKLNDVDPLYKESDLSRPEASIILTNLGDLGVDDPVLSVYKNNLATNGMYKTFCVFGKMAIAPGDYYWGKLSNATYDDNISNARKLSIGAAYLYKLYVTGEFGEFKPESEGGWWNYSQRDIGLAIRYLIHGTGTRTQGVYELLNLLRNTQVEIDGVMQPKGVTDYWSTPYDPNATYSFMDDYVVYILNVWNETGDRSQDFLFATQRQDHAPEPATILLWTLGTIGAVGYARRRSRWNKQTVRG